eukprot:5963913-Pyramimonas_sp.AAC.1
MPRSAVLGAGDDEIDEKTCTAGAGTGGGRNARIKEGRRKHSVGRCLFKTRAHNHRLVGNTHI